MRVTVIVFAVLAAGTGQGLAACSGDDQSPLAPSNDSGAAAPGFDAMAADTGRGDAASTDATALDASVSDAAEVDASVADTAVADTAVADAATIDVVGDGADDGSGDAAVPARLLLSYNSYVGANPGELSVFDLASRSVAGRLEYTGAGTTYVGASAPWLLEQSADIVTRLDGAKPWVAQSSWNVSGGVDAASNANPQAVVVTTDHEALVLSYLRNVISVIDTSSDVDGGRPTQTIDLSALVQRGGDGTVEMTAGVYVPGAKRVYVLLANINQNTFDTSTGYLQCAGQAAPGVVAIDAKTDSLVALDGGVGDAGGAMVALPGRNPAFGQGAMAYDAVANRLLVLQGGCSLAATDGGSAVVGAEVDELSLDTGATRVLLDLTGMPLPAQLTYVDAQHAFVQVGYGPFTTYVWNPTRSSLGAAVSNAPDWFAWDGSGNLLGVTARHSDAGQVTGYDVLSVKASDGTVTMLGSDPFSLTGGGVTGAQLWPAP